MQKQLFQSIWLLESVKMSIGTKILENHWSMWLTIYTHSHSCQLNTYCLYAVNISLPKQLNALYRHRNDHFLGWKNRFRGFEGGVMGFPGQCSLKLLHLPASTSRILGSKHEPRLSCMLGDHSTDWAMSLTLCVLNDKDKAQLYKLALAGDALGWKSSSLLCLCGVEWEFWSLSR